MIRFACLLCNFFALTSAIYLPTIKDDSIHHSCTTNQECADRLNPIYPPYTFVCCTTVSCNDYQSKHYIITSGCAPSSMCTFNVTVNEYTLFAVTMERSAWDAYAPKKLIGNCDLTRQVVGGLPPQQKPEKPETLQRDSPFQSVIKVSASEPRCTCPDNKQCCIRVTCVDSLQRNAGAYKVDSICQDVCPTFYTNIYEEYNIYFALDKWRLRQLYQTLENAPPVEKSCRETRYFLNWLQDNRQYNYLTSDNTPPYAA